MSTVFDDLKRQAEQSGDYKAAFEALLALHEELHTDYLERKESRFLVVGIDPDGNPYTDKITESEISDNIDMSDCYDLGYKTEYYYVDQTGTLHIVEIGTQQAINAEEEIPFRFAASSMIANGVQVGTVVYTDH